MNIIFFGAPDLLPREPLQTYRLQPGESHPAGSALLVGTLSGQVPLVLIEASKTEEPGGPLDQNQRGTGGLADADTVPAPLHLRGWSQRHGAGFSVPVGGSLVPLTGLTLKSNRPPVGVLLR